MENQNYIFSFISLIVLYIILGEIQSLILENIVNDEEEKLLFAWEHFRHGARNPCTHINKKTWIDFIGVQWQNEGELTSLGLRAHYLLGVSTKKKYEQFLSKSFNTNEIFIISTDTNRTITSALANLQGIYNNYTTQNLTINQIEKAKIKGLNETYKKKIDKKIEDLKKSYIEDGVSIMPVHIFSKVGLQYSLNGASFCPGSTKYQNEAKEQKEVKKILNDFIQNTNDTYGKYIFKFMNVSSEITPNYLFINNNLNYICDAYVADYFSGKEMPHINNTGIDMQQLYNHCVNYLIIDLYYKTYGLPPTKLAYLTVSPVFRTIFNYMDRRIKLFEENNADKIEPSSPKFVIYSGHDSSLGAVDVFLKDVFDIEYGYSQYTSSQLFELWHNKSGYFIKYLFDQEEKAVYELNTFKEKVNKNLLSESEINEICEGNEVYNIENIIGKENIYKKIFFIEAGIIFICVGLLISVIILKRKRI